MKVTYNGPDGQVNYEVGIETGAPELTPGATYDLSNELAERLLDSSAWFKATTSKKTTS